MLTLFNTVNDEKVVYGPTMMTYRGVSQLDAAMAANPTIKALLDDNPSFH